MIAVNFSKENILYLLLVLSRVARIFIIFKAELNALNK